MNYVLCIAGISAALLLGANAAAANSCATEIESLRKSIANVDASMQPTDGATTDATGDSAAVAAGQLNPAADLDQARDALQKAEALNQAGDEAGCMSQVAQAKGALVLE